MWVSADSVERVVTLRASVKAAYAGHGIIAYDPGTPCHRERLASGVNAEIGLPLAVPLNGLVSHRVGFVFVGKVTG